MNRGIQETCSRGKMKVFAVVAKLIVPGLCAVTPSSALEQSSSRLHVALRVHRSLESHVMRSSYVTYRQRPQPDTDARSLRRSRFSLVPLSGSSLLSLSRRREEWSVEWRARLYSEPQLAQSPFNVLHSKGPMDPVRFIMLVDSS